MVPGECCSRRRRDVLLWRAIRASRRVLECRLFRALCGRGLRRLGLRRRDPDCAAGSSRGHLVRLAQGDVMIAAFADSRLSWQSN